MRDGWVADTVEDAAEVFGEHFVRIARFYRKTGNLARHPGMATDEDITVASVAPHLVMGDAAALHGAAGRAARGRSASTTSSSAAG